MRRNAKIDTSLRERHGILQLLGRLRGDGVTLHEMEEIGLKFQKAGRRALRPLVRELWRESSGDLISKYAYILDFFETQSWLDQLIQMALKRRDLGDDGKAALLIILEGYGVDVHAPPLERVFAGVGTPLRHAARGALQLGEEGIVTFLDEFLACPGDIQKSVIRELGEGGDPQGARMLEALLWHEDREIAGNALEALGRIRDPLAAGILTRFLQEGYPDLRAEAERSLRRLEFLGVQPPQPQVALPFHAGYATAPDGDGYRSLMISRWSGEARLSVLYMQVHERRGLLAAWGGGSLTPEDFDTELEAFSAQDELHEVTPDYVLALLRDALYWSRDLCYLPADYYLRRGMFSGEDLTPAPYRPEFPELKAEPALSYREGEEVSRRLFADPFFAGWFIAQQRVYDFAEEFRRGDDVDPLLMRFCAELLTPDLELIRERLLHSADLMRRCGRDSAFVGRVVALARSLSDYRLPHHLHPFLRGFAMESMEIAREALAHGGAGRPTGAEES
jgi:hypothetical protein